MYDQARVERRRREHERQAVVFGVIIAFLAVCGIFALAIYSGALTSPISRPFVTPGEAGQESLPVPCLPAVDGQPDGALPVPYDQVQVRVLNASGEQGVAAAFEEALVARQFTMVAEPDNAPVTIEYSELRFGTPGITAAYTLAAHFSEIRMVLDQRQDATVDLLVGTEFDPPLDADQVTLAADKPLQNVEDCEPAAEIEPQPVITPEPEESASPAAG
jgi:hypothetical protein